MVIELNGKEHEVKFGIAFLKYVDNHNGLTVDLTVGDKATSVNTKSQGFENLLRKLYKDNDETALVDILYAGTRRSKRKPPYEEIEDYVDALITEDEANGTDKVNRLIAEVLEDLKRQPSARRLNKLMGQEES